MKNDILVRVCLPSSFSLATEHRKEEGKNERTKRQIEPWILFASHIFIQNDKAMSVEWCSVCFSFSRILFFFLVRSFVLYRLKLSRLLKYVDAFSHSRGRKEKETVQKNRGKRETKECRHRCFSIISNFSCQFPLYVSKEKTKKENAMLTKNGWMKQCTDGEDLHYHHHLLVDAYSQKRGKRGKNERRKKGEEQNACQNHKQ